MPLPTTATGTRPWSLTLTQLQTLVNAALPAAVPVVVGARSKEIEAQIAKAVSGAAPGVYAECYCGSGRGRTEGQKMVHCDNIYTAELAGNATVGSGALALSLFDMLQDLIAGVHSKPTRALPVTWQQRFQLVGWQEMQLPGLSGYEVQFMAADPLPVPV
jgi:hypothetical protein